MHVARRESASKSQQPAVGGTPTAVRSTQASHPPARHTHQGVCIQEHALAVLREGPAVQLGESDPQLGSPEEGQVDVVRAVDQVHLYDLIKHPRQDDPGKTRARLWEDGGGCAAGTRACNSKALRGSQTWDADARTSANVGRGRDTCPHLSLALDISADSESVRKTDGHVWRPADSAALLGRRFYFILFLLLAFFSKMPRH